MLYLRVLKWGGKVALTKIGAVSNEFRNPLLLSTTPPVLSTCPLHTNSGCVKERRILIGPWRPAKAALVRNYLEVYWSCAGGLSAVNAIGTQLRDPINLGLTRWRIWRFHNLSGHATAHRWRSLPRVRQHRASKPQGSSERVLPWQVTMDVGDNTPSRSRLLSIWSKGGLMYRFVIGRCHRL